MKPVFFKLIPVIAILVLVLGLPGSIPVRAAQTSPEPPAGLSAADWAQINALLAATLPAQQAYLKASNTETWDEFGYRLPSMRIRWWSVRTMKTAAPQG